MRILFFGRYDPEYARNRVLMKGLRMHGADIIECRVDPRGKFWPFKLLWKYVRMRPRFDVVFAAFSGQEAILIARILTRKPIVFDAFTSRYEEYVLDRKKNAPGSWRAAWYRWLDRIACRCADIVLTDTKAHASFFANEYHLDLEKFHPIFVGTDTDVFRPVSAEPPATPFVVHFHGSFIPLQGVRFILEAARLLQHESVMFNVIGKGQTYIADRQHAQGLGNVRFLDRVPYAELPSHIARAHVCLGIFGDTPKTLAVIPNKVYETLAMAKPLITADTPAIRELLDDRSAMLVPPADASALASAILRLKNDPDLRARIGVAGHAVFLSHATPALLGKKVFKILQTQLS